MVATNAANPVGSSTATLNGSVNAEGDTDTVKFCYSTTQSLVTTCSGGTVVSASPADSQWHVDHVGERVADGLERHLLLQHRSHKLGWRHLLRHAAELHDLGDRLQDGGGDVHLDGPGARDILRIHHGRSRWRWRQQQLRRHTAARGWRRRAGLRDDHDPRQPQRNDLHRCRGRRRRRGRQHRQQRRRGCGRHRWRRLCGRRGRRRRRTTPRGAGGGATCLYLQGAPTGTIIEVAGGGGGGGHGVNGGDGSGGPASGVCGTSNGQSGTGGTGLNGGPGVGGDTVSGGTHPAPSPPTRGEAGAAPDTGETDAGGTGGTISGTGGSGGSTVGSGSQFGAGGGGGGGGYAAGGGGGAGGNGGSGGGGAGGSSYVGGNGTSVVGGVTATAGGAGNGGGTGQHGRHRWCGFRELYGTRAHPRVGGAGLTPEAINQAVCR